METKLVCSVTGPPFVWLAGSPFLRGLGFRVCPRGLGCRVGFRTSSYQTQQGPCILPLWKIFGSERPSLLWFCGHYCILGFAEEVFGVVQGVRRSARC